MKSRALIALVTKRVMPGTVRGNRVPTRSIASKPTLVRIRSSSVRVNALIGASVGVSAAAAGTGG